MGHFRGDERGTHVDGLIALVRENAVVVMMVLFLGILYWAFRPRFRRRPGNNQDGNTPGNPGGN